MDMHAYLPPVSEGWFQLREILEPVVVPLTKPTPEGGDAFLRFAPQCK
jgi:hypothetical protein